MPSYDEAVALITRTEPSWVQSVTLTLLHVTDPWGAFWQFPCLPNKLYFKQIRSFVDET